MRIISRAAVASSFHSYEHLCLNEFSSQLGIGNSINLFGIRNLAFRFSHTVHQNAWYTILNGKKAHIFFGINQFCCEQQIRYKSLHLIQISVYTIVLSGYSGLSRIGRGQSAIYLHSWPNWNWAWLPVQSVGIPIKHFTGQVRLTCFYCFTFCSIPVSSTKLAVSYWDEQNITFAVALEFTHKFTTLIMLSKLSGK